MAIEDQGLQGGFRISGGRRQAAHDRFQHIGDAEARFGTHRQGVGGIQSDSGLDHFLGAQNVRAGQIDLVDHRDHVQAVVDGQVSIGEGLGLDSLGSVHHQKRALTAGQGTRNLVGEIDVAGRIEKI